MPGIVATFVGGLVGGTLELVGLVVVARFIRDQWRKGHHQRILCGLALLATAALTVLLIWLFGPKSQAAEFALLVTCLVLLPLRPLLQVAGVIGVVEFIQNWERKRKTPPKPTAPLRT